MSKQKIKFICTNCTYESLKWLGKCPACNEWNTFSEELVESKKSKIKVEPAKIIKLNEFKPSVQNRIETGIKEFDRVLGGGLIPGALVLIGGDPGIGKSTLITQASASIKEKILYVTGEESKNQIKIRTERLNINSDNYYLLVETNIDTIKDAIKTTEPSVVVIDSIQTMYDDEFDNAPGTVTQIRESTLKLMQVAKEKDIALILIGHVNKEGLIAGPKVLEHIVDTVLQFEGEKNYNFRILRSIKNRYGSTNEIGIFEMHETGLNEVKNPSNVFLSDRTDNISGSVVTSSMEGSRPILLEVQALVTPSHFGNPQRVATGFDYRRLSILLAVLEKRAKLKLSSHNVFLNMAGGFRIFEPAVDLAVCCSIASSLLDKPAKDKFVIIGEVGLGGEIRGISNIDKRVKEAAKLGFEKIIMPANNSKQTNSNPQKIIPVENLNEAIEIVFE